MRNYPRPESKRLSRAVAVMGVMATALGATFGAVNPADAASGATDIDVEPGDDVAAVVAGAASGSTLTFAPGTYDIAETIVVDTSLEFVGAGIGETTIASTSPGVAFAFLGPGDLILQDLSLHHVGDEAASVFLANEGGVVLRRVEIAGGVSDAGEAGHGVVFAFEDLADLPERTDEERAGDLVIEESVVSGNGGVGILATGTAEPAITRTTIEDNATCGMCYLGSAGGSLTGSTVTGNGELGVQTIGSSNPRLEGNTISGHGAGVLVADTSDVAVSGNTLAGNEIGVRVLDEAQAVIVDNWIQSSGVAGISITGSATATVHDNHIRTAAEVAVEVAGTSTATVSHNVIDGTGEVGVSFIETASGRAMFNDVQRQDIGFQVGGTAAPDLVGNTVHNSRLVGLLFAEEASGSATLNYVDQLSGSSIEVAGTSHPDLVGNDLGGSRFGIVYVDDASGTARNNRLRRHDIGAQIQNAAGPSLMTNSFDGIAVAAIVFTGTVGGTATGNDCGAGESGIIAVVDTATPTLADNRCEVVPAE